MKTSTSRWLGAMVLAIVLFFWLGLPVVLQGLGLHPAYQGPRYTLLGKRALIVTTSHGTLMLE